MIAGSMPFRLAQLSRSARLAITCFVLLIGTGYLISIAHMYFTYAEADGKPGLTPDDVRIGIAGKREKTVLEAKLVGGSMEQYLSEPQERTQLLDWIHTGGDRTAFTTVQPVLAQRCQSCHSPAGPAKFRPLTNFEEVSAVVKTDRGETPPAWARVAHIHLQGLATIFLALGLAFTFTGFSETIKLLVVPLPFVALVADFGARALTPKWPELVPVVMGAGAVGALALAVLCGGLLYELWFVRVAGSRPTAATGTPAG
ncbi:MAG: hypothetical protein ACO1SX_22300 [Actinomycetota bacterium]